MQKLKIGLFFDGTTCNAYNALHPNKKKSAVNSGLKKQIQLTRELGEEGKSFAEQIEKYTVLPNNYLPTETSSFEPYFSNVWHLFQAYRTGKTDQGYQLGIYINGVGTADGETDDLISEATGWNPVVPRGVIDKTDDAIKYIRAKIEGSDELKGKIFDSIEFELFGFSRGSTSARHFANRVKNKDKNLANVIASFFTVRTYKDINNNPTGKTSFIGLYDSVAAILALSEFDLDVNDSKTGDINIKLEKGIADNIIHFTAGHEIRYNFSLNRIVPDYVAELNLPGSHADIGGGNIDNSQEKSFISKNFTSKESINVAAEKTEAYLKAADLRKRLNNHPSWGPIFKITDIEVITWVIRQDEKTKDTGSALLFKRDSIKVGIEHVALHAMLRYAKLKGCLFNAITNTDLAIPADLQDLGKLAFSAVNDLSNGKSVVSLVDKIKPETAKKYVSCTFQWSAAKKELSEKELKGISLENAAWYSLWIVNRPNDDYLRSEFDSFGKTLII